MTNNKDTKEVIGDYLYNKFKGDANYRNEKNKLKLKANSHDNKQLNLLLNDKIDEMNQESNIFKYPVWSGTDYRPKSEEIAVRLYDASKATSLKIVAYEFLGKKSKATAYADAVCGVAETLFALEQKIIENLARQNKFGLSLVSDKFRKQTKLEGAEIYVNRHGSTENMLNAIINLLQECNIEAYEFVAYCMG